MRPMFRLNPQNSMSLPMTSLTASSVGHSARCFSCFATAVSKALAAQAARDASWTAIDASRSRATQRGTASSAARATVVCSRASARTPLQVPEARTACAMRPAPRGSPERTASMSSTRDGSAATARMRGA